MKVQEMKRVRQKILFGVLVGTMVCAVAQGAGGLGNANKVSARSKCPPSKKMLTGLAIASVLSPLLCSNYLLSHPDIAPENSDQRFSKLPLDNYKHQPLSEDNGEFVPPIERKYSQFEISETAAAVYKFPLRLLAFDGERFRVYTLNNEGLKLKETECPRCLRAVALVVGALQSRFGERFSPGSEPFQVLFSESDITTLDCMQPSHLKKCQNRTLAPILAFGSVFKDPEVAPNIKEFPNDRYTICLDDWLNPHIESGDYCWERELRQISATDFEDLVPHCIWRGSDNNPSSIDDYRKLSKIDQLIGHKNLTEAEAADYLVNHWDELRFRHRAIALSLKAEDSAKNDSENVLPWIDAKFAYPQSAPAAKQLRKHGLGFVLAEHMDINEMSQVQCQLDLVGAGGTSWKGFIYKLAMHGLVFHQEAPTKDWFFDHIQPWVHYVPIEMSLSDLYEKYTWAQENPKEAQKIAEAGRSFVKSMTEDHFLARAYQKYFVETLGQVVRSYSSSDTDLDSILDYYRSRGFELFENGVCNENSCRITTKAKNPPRTIDIPKLQDS